MSIVLLENITFEKMPTVASRLLSVLKQGDVVSLVGDLGTGKSTLSREIIRASCGGSTVVPSPTFTLAQIYDNTSIGCDIWHMDWYRLDNPDQIWELGVEEAFSTAVSLIEWSERASCYMPPETLTVSFADCGDSRTVTFTGDTSWADRLHGVFNNV